MGTKPRKAKVTTTEIPNLSPTTKQTTEPLAFLALVSFLGLWGPRRLTAQGPRTLGARTTRKPRHPPAKARGAGEEVVVGHEGACASICSTACVAQPPSQQKKLHDHEAKTGSSMRNWAAWCGARASTSHLEPKGTSAGLQNSSNASGATPMTPAGRELHDDRLWPTSTVAKEVPSNKAAH